MKVLAHLNELEPLGGVELCVLQDSTALARRGHRVDVAFGADGSLRPAFERIGSRLNGPFAFSIDYRRPWRMAATYPPAARWAEREDVDVVWLNRFEHILWGQTVARLARRPLVCTLHEVPFQRHLALLGAGVHHFTAVSDHVRDAWIANGLPPAKVTTIPNAVDGEEYSLTLAAGRAEARAALGLPQGVPVVLCYGRMIAEKGVVDLVDAWRRYRTLRRERGLAAGHLVLLGDPDPSTAAATRDAFRDVDRDEVRWFPATRDVVPHLRASDVVVFPSRMDEAFGRVVIEGMSTGRPVLATRAGAVPELLSGGFEDNLVAIGDSAALGERLSSLVDWPESDPHLGERCRAWVEQRYPYERHVDQLEDVFRRAVATRRSPRGPVTSARADAGS